MKVNPPRVRRYLSGGREAYAKGNRLIVLYRRENVTSDGGTEEARHRRVLEYPVQVRRGAWQANPPRRGAKPHPETRWGGLRTMNGPRLGFQENPLASP